MKEDTGLYTCPFLSDDGKCEIYDKRFAVCAQYGVINEIKHCDSSTMHKLMVVNPMQIMSNIVDRNALAYLMFAASGKETDILTEFELWLKE